MPTSVQDLLEAREKDYLRRASSADATATPPARRHAVEADPVLHRIEAGIYPVCEACGERIEIERLRADAFATKCGRCAAHPG